jgi:hypothetical protein
VDWIKWVRFYFDRGKRVLLWVFFFLSLIIYYLPISEPKLNLLAPFIFTATFIIIEILSKLSQHIEKNTEVFHYIPDEQEAFRRAGDEIRKLCNKRKRVENPLIVKVVGFRGRHITAWLNSFIGHHKKDEWLVNIHFYYYLIDKKFAETVEGLEHYLPNISASAHMVKDLSQKCVNDNALNSKKIRVQLFTYDNVNPFQALLIGDQHLFLSYSMPEIADGKVQDWIGPETNPYYYFKRDEEHHRFMIEVIERWLNFYGRKGPVESAHAPTQSA